MNYIDKIVLRMFKKLTDEQKYDLLEKLTLENKELKEQLTINKNNSKLFCVNKDEVLYCGYKVVISEICSKKWCIITDENNHHYNARIKDLKPRNF